MRISDVIAFKVGHEAELKQRFLEMDCFFQDHMWDGYSEDNGQFISQQDFDAIEALSDKIFHMIMNIGCPLSVPEMLHSICTRKIKYWQLNGDNKGRQLKDKACRARARSEYYYESDKEKMVIKGHFRWNNRGYILSRKATELLLIYLENKF